MESWERRCWQCIILGYIVTPLLLLRLPIAWETGDSRAQYCTTVFFALGRAVADTVFMQLLGVAAIAWFSGSVNICISLVNSTLDLNDHLWKLASFLWTCAKSHMQGEQPLRDPFDGIEQMIEEDMNRTWPHPNTYVHAAMHRDPYKIDTGDYTLLSSSCVQTALRSNPYHCQSGDFTLLYGSCILKAFASDPYAVDYTHGTLALTKVTRSNSDAAVHTADGSSSSQDGAVPASAETVKNATHVPTSPAVTTHQPAASLTKDSSTRPAFHKTSSGIAVKAADADNVAHSVSDNSKTRIASSAADVVSNKTVNLEASAAVIGMTATVEAVFTTAPVLGTAAFDPSESVQATPLLAAATKAAFASNVEAIDSVAEASKDTHVISKPSLQKRLSAQFSTAKGLTSKLSLKRISPTFSMKAPSKPSLASRENVDSIDDVTSAADPQPTLPAKARNMLRRSTSSFKIAANKISTTVRPACIGAR